MTTSDVSGGRCLSSSRLWSTQLSRSNVTTWAPNPFGATFSSRDEAQGYRRELEGALETVRERRSPHRDALVSPAGLDRAIVAGHPLPVATQSLLRQAELMEGDNALSAYEVLCMPYVGSRAIRDLFVVVDAFLNVYIETFEGRTGQLGALVRTFRHEIKTSGTQDLIFATIAKCSERSRHITKMADISAIHKKCASIPGIREVSR